MGQSVGIIHPPGLTPTRLLELVRDTDTFPEVFLEAEELSLQHHARNVHVRFSLLHEGVYADMAREDYQSNPDVDPALRVRAMRYDFTTVRFTDASCVRPLLRTIARELATGEEPAWIDTNHGWVMRVEDFLAKTDDPSWDWRQDHDIPVREVRESD